MVPGPVACHPKVLKALAAQPLHPRDPKFIDIVRGVLQGLRHVFGAPEGQPVLFNGGGLLAMEVAVANFVDPNDHVLIINNGFFGEEFLRVTKCYSQHVESLEAPLGERVPLQDVEMKLDSQEFQVLALSHVDTGSGVKSQLQDLVATAQKRDIFTIVDAVSSVGGEPLEQTRWGIDVCFASTQKALAGPPGIALLMLSAQAMNHLSSKATPISSIYLNLQPWITSMQSYESDEIPRLVSTPASNLIAALDSALQLIREEGLAQRIQRHHQIATQLRRGLTSMGLELVPKHPDYYSNMVTTMYSPNQTLATEIVEHMIKEGVRIAPGLGKHRETLLRIGHMGTVTPADVNNTISALQRTLTKLQK